MNLIPDDILEPLLDDLNTPKVLAKLNQNVVAGESLLASE